MLFPHNKMTLTNKGSEKWNHSSCYAFAIPPYIIHLVPLSNSWEYYISSPFAQTNIRRPKWCIITRQMGRLITACWGIIQLYCHIILKIYNWWFTLEILHNTMCTIKQHCRKKSVLAIAIIIQEIIIFGSVKVQGVFGL